MINITNNKEGVRLFNLIDQAGACTLKIGHSVITAHMDQSKRTY